MKFLLLIGAFACINGFGDSATIKGATRRDGRYPCIDLHAQIYNYSLFAVSTQYKVIRKIGEGGMGQVFLAEDVNQPGKYVALKKNENTKITYREIRNLRKKGIEASSYYSDGSEYVVLPFISRTRKRPTQPAPSLDELLIKNIEAWTLSQKEELVTKLLNEVEDIHKHSLVHSDLKPGNILIQSPKKNPRVVVVDYGIAWDMEGFNDHMPIGTIDFVGKEALKGEKVTPERDVESLKKIILMVYLPELYKYIKGHSTTPPATLIEKKWRGDRWSDIGKTFESDPSIPPQIAWVLRSEVPTNIPELRKLLLVAKSNSEMKNFIKEYRKVWLEKYQDPKVSYQKKTNMIYELFWSTKNSPEFYLGLPEEVQRDVLKLAIAVRKAKVSGYTPKAYEGYHPNIPVESFLSQIEPK